ncbi:hypothetical protein QFC24_004753 [Naganishia onofrii]|uniref:Uncharacterized protein n=1 Tax=Naganishia onofrii TaxID=1851511 RepID=A0ACC2XCU8_9TREE|nr:hypothetical protein QFC24_004753 [Naganishia onofrii]
MTSLTGLSDQLPDLDEMLADWSSRDPWFGSPFVSSSRYLFSEFGGTPCTPRRTLPPTLECLSDYSGSRYLLPPPLTYDELIAETQQLIGESIFSDQTILEDPTKPVTIGDDRVIRLYQDVSRWLASIEETERLDLLRALDTIVKGMTERPRYANDDTEDEEDATPYIREAAGCALFEHATGEPYQSRDLRMALAAAASVPQPAVPNKDVRERLQEAVALVEDNFGESNVSFLPNRVKFSIIASAKRYQQMFEHVCRSVS